MNKWTGMVALLGVAAATQAAEFHVTTAQELQNALTAAAANSEGDTVYVAAGYYTGNFNFNSSEAQDLTIQAESGVANHEITIDGAGTGRSMNLTATAAANLTVSGLTFTRNCNDFSNAGLRFSTQGGDVLAEDCRAIGTGAAQGIGIEVAAARNAVVRRCTVSCDVNSGGDGIRCNDGITGSVTVDQNTVSGSTGISGRGVSVSASSTNVLITVCNNIVSSNCTAGIYVYQGASTLTGNTVTGNRSRGICVYESGTTTITGNTVSGTINGESGGGIYVDVDDHDAAILMDNMVSGNTGGGIYVDLGRYYGATVILTDNTVSGNTRSNTGDAFGGGIKVTTSTDDNGTVILMGNTVSGNTVFSPSTSSSYDVRGGGIYVDVENGTATLTGNTVSENTASASAVSTCGGGIYAGGATVKLLNNIIENNVQTTANGAGGGVYANASELLDMVNNTITENTAAGNGGGVAFQVDGVTEVLHVYNNIVWNNAADGNGDDVHLAGSGSRKEFMNNDAHDLYGVWDITQNNIDAAPLFYDAANRNYHLRYGSPCLNAGTNGAPSIPDTDIDGETRIEDGAVDIGADEMSNTDPHPADLNDDWVISEAEYTAYAAAWKNDQTWSRQPNPIPADYVTRAGYLKQQASGAYRNDGGPKPVCWVPDL